MKLQIVHVTRYDYGEAVTTSHHLAHLMPRDSGRQRCLGCEVEIAPNPLMRVERLDYFGNRVLHFGFTEPHRELEVTARSQVEVRPLPDLDLDASPPWDQLRERLRRERRRDLLDALAFTFDSPMVRAGAEMRDYASACFPPGRPVLAAVRALTKRIHADFTYDSRATEVSTPVEEVLESRRGVCQDFAHLQLACLRALGLPARYVSGYILTQPPPGRPRLVGADASHAWISLFVPELGWLDFDPTNDVMPSLEHVTVAVGRDFSEVTPIRGVILGGGAHSVQVSVDVRPVG